MIRKLRQSFPVASKDHKCEFCGMTIRRGEKHVRMTIVDNGKINNVRPHFECEKLSNKLNFNTKLRGWLFRVVARVYNFFSK